MKTLLTLLMLTTPLFAQDLYYLIHAKKGYYDAKTEYLLLQNVDLSVTYYTQTAPKRAGKTTLDKFLFDIYAERKEINAGFIYFEDHDVKFSDIPVKLTNPHYDFDRKELSFNMENLSMDESIHREFHEITLYVMDVPNTN